MPTASRASPACTTTSAHPPAELGELLAAYCGGRPARVIDLGSGTGLSTRWAATWADEVIGVEPSDDMRATATASGGHAVRYRPGWSHTTGLEDSYADVVLAVQALHWMEPGATFAEVARLLRPGGVFAAVDCDWPPVVGDAAAEQAWEDCRLQLRAFKARLADGLSGEALRGPLAAAELDPGGYSASDAHRRRRLSEGLRSWSKTERLERMVASGAFGWCREVALAGHEDGDAARFVGLLRSQGNYQTLLRNGLDDTTVGMAHFARIVGRRLGDEPRPWRFVYHAPGSGSAPTPPS